MLISSPMLESWGDLGGGGVLVATMGVPHYIYSSISLIVCLARCFQLRVAVNVVFSSHFTQEIGTGVLGLLATV